MTGAIAEISPHKAARIAGYGYLIIIVAGIFAEFIIRSNLIVQGDAATTAANIIASEQLFRISIASDLVMLICDVTVAFALYLVLVGVNKGLTLLATFFRLVHSAIYGINLLMLLLVVMLLGGESYLSVIETSQRQAFALLLINGHSIGYLIGLVFFGVHCAVLGYLIFKSRYMPRALGVLLMVAAAGYLIDSFARVLMMDYGGYESIFSIAVFVPALVAELSLCVWLMVGRIRLTREQPKNQG